SGRGGGVGLRATDTGAARPGAHRRCARERWSFGGRDNGRMPMRVPLSLACGAYDRTAALARGDIRPEGVDLTFLALPVEETFFRMTRHREFDAAEMSLSSYLISLDQGAPFAAIPAFVSRAFRHNGIYGGAASGAVDPAGLAGGVVGVAEYQLTANVWI